MKLNTDLEDGRPRLRLRVFGAVEAWSWTGESILPRGRKAQAILAYLAMCGEPTVPRRRLARLLWSTRWEEQARASLRQSLMELRRSIIAISPELLCIENDRVSLQIAKVWIDGIGGPTQVHRSICPLQQDPNTFLESLRGLDAAFDRWIDARLAASELSNDLLYSSRIVGKSAPATQFGDGASDDDFTTGQSEHPRTDRRSFG
ncbi:hypothetical protein [Bradyrhizobium sp. Cp5.3]|uniref:AfsR/SARP family transcriptional regulator n=1 Tax=Bradyrhizobium sp. Cp5.3 TaxID=443598 RepID=UPI0012EC922A|nr:hypothetical protein [Bradyrhizobium sp. Cp5.3]